jgi:thymidylate kinase
MTIVEIRGTSGSGKTTLVREIMSGYDRREDHFKEGRRQPLWLTMYKEGLKPLSVIGHMNSACSGCDTIKTLDEVFTIVNQEHNKGHHVIFEGMLLCSDVKRITALSHETNAVVIISLTTPIEQCCDNIRKRRAAKGNEKELNEKNTRTRFSYEEKQVEKLKAANVDIRTLIYEDAADAIRQAFD